MQVHLSAARITIAGATVLAALALPPIGLATVIAAAFTATVDAGN